MKSKIFLYLSLFAGLAFTACNDDDITVNTTPILDAQSVVTGSADVTATTATLHATVKGLENSSPQSYTVGFNYGMDENSLTQSVNGSLAEGVVTAELTGLADGTTIYYQAFAKLQGKVTFTGEVKSLTTTDATVETKTVGNISDVVATLGATVTNAPAGTTYGIVIAPATVEADEDVRAGLIVPADVNAEDFVVTMSGLVPSTTYKYAGYADLGAGVIYGEVVTFTTSESTIDVNDDLVDLGLSVKWAKYNVGAHSEGELGGRFGFGDIYGVLNTTVISDYASADIYRTAYDVANSAYGGRATLPSAADFKELFDNCTKEWITLEDGVSGYKFTGPNGNSIFMPAAGSRTVNEVSGEGVDGMYATGSIVGEGSKFAVAYNFSSSSAGKVNAPVYQALSVRAVSTARSVPFNKSLLYNTWEIDYNAGKSIRFDGPVHFYGTDDCWRTVTNKEPLVGDVWAWEADASNEWAFGDCSGYMTLTEDGNIIVKMQDGAEAKGTYTVNESDMTITSTIDLLHPAAMSGYADYKTNIKILALDSDRFQIGFFRDSDPATVSVNMIPQGKKYGLSVQLSCAGSDWNGIWGAELASILPDEIFGKHTLVYEGSFKDPMVFLLDIVGLSEKFPGAIATVTDIRLDGESIAFDGSKMFYGDIENNGAYRFELFNAVGKGSADGVVVESPFSNGQNMQVEPAINFTEKIEFDIFVSETSTFTPFVGGMNENWGGVWDAPAGAQSFNVNLNNNKIEFTCPTSWSAELVAEGFETGPRVLCVRIPGLYGLFPDMQCSLDGVAVDGNAVAIVDPSLALNGSADGNGVDYELTIYNQWNETLKVNSSLGAPVGELLPAAAFSNSVKVDFTIKNLFKAPQF